MRSGSTVAGSFTAALRRRRRRERRIRLVAIGLAVGLLALALLAWALLVLAPWFRVGSIRVEGDRAVLDDGQVVAAAGVPTGGPLVQVDTDGAEERLAALPAVADVTVSRSFPDTVVIDVTERSAVYARDAGGSWGWVDADGVEFHTTTGNPPENLLTASVDGDSQRLRRDVATVVHWIPPDVATQVEKVEADAVDHITLRVEGGREVLWGSADDSELKSEVIGLLMQNKPDAKVYDVSAPTHPTTR